MAHYVLGLLDVDMPIMYGEGSKAYIRGCGSRDGSSMPWIGMFPRPSGVIPKGLKGRKTATALPLSLGQKWEESSASD